MHTFLFPTLILKNMRGGIWLVALILLVGCTSPQATQALATVNIAADGHELTVEIPVGSTVDQALKSANLSLEPLDRTEPPLYTVVARGDHIRLIRVTEKFEVEQSPIPFERQTLRNESLPKDKQILLQAGKNGLQEITYRRVFEDGSEISSKPIPIKNSIVEAPVPEIIMVGIQAPFFPVALPGKLVYLRDGNAWMIQSNTGNRRVVVTAGDLDGRVFSLSADGTWLLFTRRSTEPGKINALWAADISSEGGKLIDLKVPNVVHFADWVPGSNSKVVFSTVEPRSTAPGWQANNDLNVLTFSTSGWTTKWDVITESNTGGVYGWWGTNFSWSPDGQQLAYTRPDGVGLTTFHDGVQTPLMQIVPYQTRSDWAWVPGLTWGPDGKVLYTVDHVAPPGSPAPEESQAFDLTAFLLEGARPLHLISQSGLFAYPLASPVQTLPSGETGYQIAYLQAALPGQSETSRYRIMLIDRDGSDPKTLFPSEGEVGMKPQSDWGAWSPAPLPESGHFFLAVLHQGNLWLVDASSGKAQQVTGDGLTSRVVWK